MSHASSQFIWKTYPTIIIFVQKTHKHSTLQLHLIFQCRLEIQLYSVDKGLGGTACRGNSGGTIGWAGALAG